MTVTHLHWLLVGFVKPDTGSTCTASSKPDLDENCVEPAIAERMQFENRRYVSAMRNLAAFRIGFD